MNRGLWLEAFFSGCRNMKYGKENRKKVKERRKQPVKDEEENKKNSMPLYYPDSKRLERTFNRYV